MRDLGMDGVRRGKKLRTTTAGKDGHRANDLLERDFTAPAPNTRAGSQYTSLRYTEHLALECIAPSIGTVGDAYDNGLRESIIGLFKTEAISTDVFHIGPLKTIVDVEYATAGWVDWWNHRRLHSSIGHIPPAEHEQAYYAALNREPRPV